MNLFIYFFFVRVISKFAPFRRNFVCIFTHNRLVFRLVLTVGNRVLLPVVAGQSEPGMRQRDLGRRALDGGVHYQLIERVEAEKSLVNGYPVLGSRESHLGRVVHLATCEPPDQFDCPIII